MANYYTHLAFEIAAASADAERFRKAIEEAAVGTGGAGDEDERLEGIACRFDQDSGTLGCPSSDHLGQLAA